jgi:hypothetical protein
MEINACDKRRFERCHVQEGLLFSDNDHLIGLAQVVDISKCGVRCISLSKINCTICTIENIELFGTRENMYLTGLSGKMTRCDDMTTQVFDPGLSCYEFGFEFFPDHYLQINRLKKSLSEGK